MSPADHRWKDGDTRRRTNKDKVRIRERERELGKIEGCRHPILTPQHPGLLSHNSSLCQRLGHPQQWQICLSQVQGLSWQVGILTTKINFETYQLFLCPVVQQRLILKGEPLTSCERWPHLLFDSISAHSSWMWLQMLPKPIRGLRDK